MNMELMEVGNYRKVRFLKSKESSVADDSVESDGSKPTKPLRSPMPTTKGVKTNSPTYLVTVVMFEPSY